MSKARFYKTIPLTEDELESKDIAVRLTDIEGLSHPLSNYSVAEKLTCVSLYFVLGNMSEVSRRTSVDQNAIKYWKTKSDWWKEAIARLKLQKNEEFEATLTRLMEETLTEIEDRLIKGDEIILSSGEKVRKRMGGKELTVTYAVLSDKRAMMRGDPTSITQGGGNTQNEVLLTLVRSFKELSQDIKKTENEKVVSNQ